LPKIKYSKSMSNEEMILKELRSIRLALEITAPKRWQKIPEASKTLGIPQSRIKALADAGTIPVSVLAVTKCRKHYLVDVVKTRQLIEEGGMMPKVK
jgi:hypothetical protein